MLAGKIPNWWGKTLSSAQPLPDTMCSHQASHSLNPMPPPWCPLHYHTLPNSCCTPTRPPQHMPHPQPLSSWNCISCIARHSIMILPNQHCIIAQLSWLWQHLRAPFLTIAAPLCSPSHPLWSRLCCAFHVPTPTLSHTPQPTPCPGLHCISSVPWASLLSLPIDLGFSIPCWLPYWLWLWENGRKFRDSVYDSNWNCREWHCEVMQEKNPLVSWKEILYLVCKVPETWFLASLNYHCYLSIGI